jgi:peptidase M28-like protein
MTNRMSSRGAQRRSDLDAERPAGAGVACMLLLIAWIAGACGRSPQPPPLGPAVDLLAQAEPASEIVDAALLARHTQALLAADDPASYLATALRSIGLVPGGAKGGWVQPFEDRRSVARPSGTWVLARGEARATLGTADVVVAFGGRGTGIRLRGLPAVFVAPTLAAPAGALASKVVVVLDPGSAVAVPGAPDAPPVVELLRRAAAARAHAVLVLPRPGVAAGLPSPKRAAELAAGGGVPVVAWLNETAAQALVRVGLGVGLEALPRLEWRGDLLPLALGTLHAEVRAQVDRAPRRNLVAVLPRRAGGGDETVAVVAELLGSRRRAAVAPGADPRLQAAAAAELLAVATAFQALSDPPRRTVVFAFTDPGDDGLAGARRLLADPRWPPAKLSAALVLAGGNLGPPTAEVRFVGARASPLYGLTARLAAIQGRRVGEAAPRQAPIWSSPAWAFIQARVPAALLEPGALSRNGPAVTETGVVVAAVAPAPPPFSGLREDARLAFRLALELAEGGRAPRVDPAQVEAVLRRPVEVAAPIAAPARPRQARREVEATVTPGGEATGAPSVVGARDGEVASELGGQASGPSNVPEFVAPPPVAPAPSASEPAPPARSPSGGGEQPPAAVASPTPPQRG